MLTLTELPLQSAGRIQRLPNLTVVQRFADDGQRGRQRDAKGLTDDRAGVTGVAVNGRRAVVAAADNRQTEGNCKKNKIARPTYRRTDLSTNNRTQNLPAQPEPMLNGQWDNRRIVNLRASSVGVGRVVGK